MTDVLVYDKDFRLGALGDNLTWHSIHRIFASLVPDDRLWIVTSGASLGKGMETPAALR